MAQFQTSSVIELTSGHSGNAVFVNDHRCGYIRNRNKCTSTNSRRQQKHQWVIKQISYHWKYVISQAIRDSYNNAIVYKINKFGIPYRLDGFHLFMSQYIANWYSLETIEYNYYLPPSELVIISANVIANHYPGEVFVHFVSRVAPPFNVIVKMSRPVPRSVYYPDNLQCIGSDGQILASEKNLTSSYLGVFPGPLTVGKKIFYEFWEVAENFNRSSINSGYCIIS